MNVFFKSNKEKNETGIANMDAVEYGRSIHWSKKFKVVNIEECVEPVSFDEVIKMAEEKNLDIFIVNETADIGIVKIIDMQKYIYEMKKSKKEQEKRQKAQQVKTKEIRISLSISDHDLDIKVKHAKEFLDAGDKVKFCLKLRGREGQGDAGQKYVREFFESALEKFNCDNMTQYTFDKIKSMGGTVWTEITK